MHARCSLGTIGARYAGATRAPGRRLLERLVCTDVAILAFTPLQQVVGLANVAGTEEDEDVAELAVLVEDGWQHRGVGSALVRQSVGAARGLGFEELYGVAARSGSWAEHALGRFGETLFQQTPFGEVVVRLRLWPHHLGLLGPPLPHGQAAVSQPLERAGPTPLRPLRPARSR
jgi:GNAT superfamily N-acetyltransferase